MRKSDSQMVKRERRWPEAFTNKDLAELNKIEEHLMSNHFWLREALT